MRYEATDATLTIDGFGAEMLVKDFEWPSCVDLAAPGTDRTVIAFVGDRLPSERQQKLIESFESCGYGVVFISPEDKRAPELLERADMLARIQTEPVIDLPWPTQQDRPRKNNKLIDRWGRLKR